MQRAMLQAGYAEIDLNPPLGGSMPGYFADRKATGSLDPLKAKALVLRQGEESVALVMCDLIGMGAELVRRIRQEVKKQGQGPGQVWVHCTHTHTGGFLPRREGFTSDAAEIYPDFYQGQPENAWVQEVVERTARAAVLAARGAEGEPRVTLHAGRSDVGHYRRYVMKDGSVRTNPGRKNANVVRPAGEIDPRVHVLRFEKNRVLAVIYGMHPDCVGGTLYSADYPGHLAETLRHALGIDWRVIFFNACCGNINHIDIQDASQKSGPAEASRLGQALALAALEALKEGKQLPPTPLRARTKQVECKLRKPRPEDVREAEEMLRTYKQTGKNPFGFNELYAPAAIVLARTKDTSHTAEIAALRLGDFGLAFLPGEIFVELGREVEESSPFKPTRTIGLTNGAMGYIPTRRGYAEGGYEAGYRSARYEPDNGHRWARTAAELLQEMA